jgi:hypothetical protein
VLHDNPKTLNAGISHAKRGLPIVIARSGKNILNFTKSFNQFFEAGQAFGRRTVHAAFVEFSLEAALENR